MDSRTLQKLQMQSSTWKDTHPIHFKEVELVFISKQAWNFLETLREDEGSKMVKFSSLEKMSLNTNGLEVKKTILPSSL